LDASFLFVQALNGAASAASLFIVAAGLTLVFGVTRIVNFAHGSFYMLGAYFAVTIIPRLIAWAPTLWAFLAGAILAAACVGAVGVLVELLILRRIYAAPELLQLLATFGVVLVTQDIVLKVWGPLDILGPRAPGLEHAVVIAGHRFPTYELFMIAVGPLVLAALWLVLHRTRFGVLVRAAREDREMVSVLGVNQSALFTATLLLGAGLAGLAGALQTPRLPADPQMDLAIIAEAFVVTVVGGMGSIAGAFLAAVLIGELQAFGILIFPKVTLVLVFALMAAVLMLRPRGLLGDAESPASRGSAAAGVEHLARFGPAARMATAAAVAVAVLLPIAGDAYLTKVAIEVFCFALAAFALNFLIGVGGIVSFGHAAFFGLGAYAAALAAKSGAAMLAALAAAALAAGLAALLVGYFVVRLAGIYLAMLTLAFAQITYAVAFQWVEITGGDNGIVGIWPAPWAASRAGYYYLTLGLAAAAVALLWRAVYAPFGLTLRAARDSMARAEAIGIDVYAHRRLAFMMAGAAAGLAGGLFAFAKGSIDPTLLSIPLSVDFLAMVLLGGVESIVGPLVGAGIFHAIRDFAMPLTDYWRLLLGAAIIAIVVAFPRGLVGGAGALLEALAPHLTAAWKRRNA
jgi:branched-chain amino acid transport system permease protein